MTLMASIKYSKLEILLQPFIQHIWHHLSSSCKLPITTGKPECTKADIPYLDLNYETSADHDMLQKYYIKVKVPISLNTRFMPPNCKNS